MRNLLFIAYLATTLCAIHSMEKPKKRLIRTKKSSSVIETKKINSVSNQPCIIQPCIFAAINDNTQTIINFMRDPFFDPNKPRNHLGETIFHISIKNSNYQLTKALLPDHRLDLTIRNNTGLLASQILKTNRQEKLNPSLEKDLDTLQQQLFSRSTLDIEINNVVNFSKESHQKGEINFSIIERMIKIVKEKFNTINNHQSTELPPDVCFPPYATDEFLEKKIWFTLHSSVKS